MREKTKVMIFGAGSVGCYLGGCLAATGTIVTLIGRERIRDQISQYGLTVTDWKGRREHIAQDRVLFSTEPSVLCHADFILLCVKSADTLSSAKIIAQHAKSTAVIVSFQNGVVNGELLQQNLSHTVLKGMVPFNVLNKGNGQFHCGTEGDLAIEDAQGISADLIARFTAAQLPVSLYRNITPVQYAKLMMNLNNVVNALSGLPLKQQLGNRAYRRVMAVVLDEALNVYRACGIKPARTGKIVPQWMPYILRLPDWLFRLVAASTLKIDPQARSSMYEDLALGRTTEIDYLNGEIVKLAKQKHIHVPVNEHLIQLVKAAELKANGAPELAAHQLFPKGH